jgi:hypothetical protein
MQPATTIKARRPLIKKVIKLHRRKPVTGLCNLSFTSVEKPASRKKPNKRVIEKLLPAAPKITAPENSKFGNNFESELAECLFSDIRDIFKLNKGTQQLRTKAILDGLTKKFPWSIICSGKAINSRRLAVILRPFGISSRDIRVSGRAYKGYKLEWFLD